MEQHTPESKTNQKVAERDEICKTSIPGSNPGGASKLFLANFGSGCGSPHSVPALYNSGYYNRRPNAMHADNADGPTHVKYRYLDASALAKLYVDEPHSETMRAFLNAHPKPFQTTALCFAEAMNVLKRKWQRKQMPNDRYLEAVRHLTIDAWGKVVEVQDYGVFDPFIQNDLGRSSRLMASMRPTLFSY